MERPKVLKCPSGDAVRVSASMRRRAPHAEEGAEPAEMQARDAKYWHSRAERTRKQALRYEEAAVRDHFVKIADGYDELARRVLESRGEAELNGDSSQGSSGQDEVGHAPEELNFRSDEVRVRDALEDDEVREVLQAIRDRSP